MSYRYEFDDTRDGAAAPDWDTGCNRVSFQSESDARTGSECPQWREHS